MARLPWLRHNHGGSPRDGATGVRHWAGPTFQIVLISSFQRPWILHGLHGEHGMKIPARAADNRPDIVLFGICGCVCVVFQWSTLEARDKQEGSISWKMKDRTMLGQDATFHGLVYFNSHSLRLMSCNTIKQELLLDVIVQELAASERLSPPRKTHILEHLLGSSPPKKAQFCSGLGFKSTALFWNEWIEQTLKPGFQRCLQSTVVTGCEVPSIDKAQFSSVLLPQQTKPNLTRLNKPTQSLTHTSSQTLAWILS